MTTSNVIAFPFKHVQEGPYPLSVADMDDGRNLPSEVLPEMSDYEAALVHVRHISSVMRRDPAATGTIKNEVRGAMLDWWLRELRECYLAEHPNVLSFARRA